MGFCYQKNFFNPTLPVDEAQFYALVRATKWGETIDEFRKTGNQKLKRGLPAFIFQAMFDETASAKGKIGRWRKQSATRLTGLVVMDVDHVENPQEKYLEWKALDFGKLGILLVYVTPSGHGLKIIFKADVKKGNLIDNQHAMAEVLGVEVDESCKDASRMSFICKESDILYIDKELFTYENKEFSERYTALYRDGHSQGTKEHCGDTQGTGTQCTASGAQMCQSPCVTESQENSCNSCNSCSEEKESCSEIKWRGYDVQSIIDCRYAGKLPCAADSNRHTESLKLATDLLLMLDGDKTRVQRIVEAQPWVQEIIKERDENVAQTVSSAAECVAQKEKKNAGSLPSKAMQEAVKSVTGKAYQEIIKGVSEQSAGVTDGDVDRWLWMWGEKIEEIFDDFPILKDVCKGLKRNQFPAALFVSGGLMMTLMTRCTYRFYHRPEELRRLNNSTLIIGDPASGKSFATRLFKLLAAPIVAADRLGKDAINAYRELMRTKGANKEKPKKPKVIVRVHPARTSNAQFIQDMVNSVEEVDGQPMQLHMLTFDTELDNTVTVQKGGSWIDKQSLELKAFHNEEDGQAYSNNDSILQDFIVTWNFIYTGTPNALKNKVNEKNFGTGLATRLTCIPLPSTKYKMLEREKHLDFDSDDRLKEWAFKLDKTKGILSLDKIVDELYEWTARRMADAEENDSKADEMLLKRCAYHGLNFAAPFIVMRHWANLHKDGDYWCGDFETDDIDWRLAELIVNIQYACQKFYFGAMAEKYFDDKTREAATNVQRKAKTMRDFDRLPDEFTPEIVMTCFGLSTIGAARSKINRLMGDDLVKVKKTYKENGTNKCLYCKTGKIMI